MKQQKYAVKTPFAIGSKVWPGLSKLMEECGEVLQIVGKIVGTGGDTKHWAEENLATRLEEELGDALAAINFVMDNNPQLRRSAILLRCLEKQQRFEQWHAEPIPPISPEKLGHV